MPYQRLPRPTNSTNMQRNLLDAIHDCWQGYINKNHLYGNMLYPPQQGSLNTYYLQDVMNSDIFCVFPTYDIEE